MKPIRCLECNRATRQPDICGLCEICSALEEGSWVPPHELCARPSCGKARCAGPNYLSSSCRQHEVPPG